MIDSDKDNATDEPIEIGNEADVNLDKQTDQLPLEDQSADPTQQTKDIGPLPQDDPKMIHQKNALYKSNIEAKGTVDIGDKIFNEYKEYKDNSTNIFYKLENQEGQLFTVKYLEKLEQAVLQKETSDEVAVFDAKKLEELRQVLLEKRIVFIYGDENIGKSFLSKKLATILVKDNLVDQIYQSKPLFKKMNIDLPGFLNKEEGIKNSLLIFNDFLAYNNNNIYQLFLNLRSTTYKNLLQKPLEDQNAYLIFTCNTGTCEEIIKTVGFPKIGVETETLKEAQLIVAFDRIKAKLFAQFALKEEVFQKLDTFLTANKNYIVGALNKVGAITAFLHSLISKAKKQREVVINEVVLQQELDKFASLSDWLKTELKESEELWFWAISFTLCQCTPGNEGIPFNLFETIRRELLKHLNTERLTENKNLEATILRSEEFYIEKCQAESYTHFTTNARLIRFKEANFKEKVWATLLKYYLASLNRLYEPIEVLADHPKARVRNYAASMLGRLSEGFPNEAYQIVKSWSVHNSRQAQIGYFFLGVWAVPNQKHKERFLNFLAQLAQSGNKNKKLSPSQKQQVHAAIRAYTTLSNFLLKPALKAFGKILENRLGTQAATINILSKDLEQFELFASKNIKSFQDAREHAALNQIGKLIISLLFKEKGEDFQIAIHIQGAIAYLCAQIDTATVFKELTKWILKGNKSLQILLTHLFLEDDGIADLLNRFTIQLSDKKLVKNTVNCHPVVYSLFSGDHAVKAIATFINSLMDSIYALPLQSRRIYRQYIFVHLRYWVKNSVQLPIVVNPMVALYVEIMLTSKEMETDIKFDMEYHFTPNNDRGLFVFKKEVLRQYYRRGWR